MLASKLFAAPPLAWLQAPRGIRHLVLRAGVQRISKLFSPLSYRDIDLPYRPPLAGRKYLPGSELGGFPEFLPGPQESFPKAYWIEENKELDIDGWGMLCRSHIDNNLADYGAILYRNLPLASTEDFSQFVRSLDYKPYEAGVTGYRSRLTNNVHSASDDPPEFNMEPHNEAAYSQPHHPTKIFFFCVKAPKAGSGGETALVKNESCLSHLDPNFLRKIDEKQIRYQAFLPNKGAHNVTKLTKSWQDRFWENNVKKVEEELQSLGYDYSWDKNSNLRYWYKGQAFLDQPTTGQKVWFNQLTCHHASYFRAHPNFENTAHIPDEEFPFHSSYGDGSEFAPEELQHIRVALWSSAVGFQWQDGDVVVADNTQVMHSRLSWTGSRRLVTSLAW